MKKRILFTIVLIFALILSLSACFGKKIQSIEISGGAPTEVLVDETPDFSGIKILVTYNDLSTEEIGFNDVTISPVDTSRPGKVEYTITYEGVTITASLEVKVPTTPDTPNTPVAPTLMSLAYRSGLKTSIYKGDVFDTSALTITATYSDGSTKIVEAKDLKLSEIDSKKAGEQTLTITYESLTIDITITVVEVVPVGIEIDAESVNTTVAEGQNPDISNLKVYLVHNNGFKYAINSNDPELDADNFPTYPDLNWVITYGSFSTTVKLSNTPPVIESIKVNSGYPTWVLLTETYVAENLTATATLSNNLTKTVSGLTLSSVDTTTAGKKTVTATYTNEDGTFTDTFEIEVVTVTAVAIDTGSFETVTTVGKFDVSGLRVDLTLSNGEFIERSEGVTVNYFDGFNKDTVCYGEITATFHGVTSGPVNITIADEVFKHIIVGTSNPDQLANWSSFKNSFLDSGYGYVVGHNNPFQYVLKFNVLDTTTFKPVEKYLGYTGVSEVLLDGAPVGSEYVTIDEVNHTFQFTKAAEGKTFTIKTRPGNIDANKIEDFTKELTVTVVDAYNIHDAKELNVITNVSKSLGNSGYDQLTVVNTFLNNNNITRPATLNGVVLHDNFIIQRTDLPAEYFFNGTDGNTYIWDHQSIYYHELQSKGEFNFYGNYFTINTYNIPIVAPEGTMDKISGKASNDDDNYSSSEIFRFHIADALWMNDPDFNHADYVFNIYALGMNDNDEKVSVEDPTASQRHKLGVYAFKIAKATYNLNAVNATRYYMTVMQEYDCVTMNLNYTKFYNSWQAHVNTWTSNLIDDKDATTLHKYHAPTTININNSFVGKAGGPAILCMNENPEYACNSQSKPIVTITNSEVFSYVTGEEAWFNAHGINGEAVLIGSISDDMGNGASFLTQFEGNTNRYMNMIMINMDEKYVPGSGIGDPVDIDGTLTIDGTTALDMEDGMREVYVEAMGGLVTMPSGYGNGYVEVIKQQTAGLPTPPPIFVSSNGGVGYSDLETFNPVTGPEVYTGDYLALYWYNLGIALGFNESTTAEPTPPAAPWVTEAHAYN